MSDLLIEQLAQVTGVRDLEQLDLSLVALLCETLVPQRASVYATVLDSEQQRWYLRAAQSPGDEAPHSDAHTVRMDALPLREAHPLRSACARDQQMRTGADAEGFLSCYPLFEDAGCDGVLELRSAAPLERREHALVSSLLRFYGNFRWLVRDNERDLLTGLLNRKPFDEQFDRALRPLAQAAGPVDDARDREAEQASWLAVIDIDHFKQVNDRYGHLVGDEVLLLMARLLRTAFRHSDKAFRFGGEEFVLLMRGAHAAGAQAALEKFRARVQAHDFPQVGTLTVSVGYTRLLADDTSHSAIERADRAVYVAKDSGRNQVLGFERLVDAGRLAPLDQGGSIDFF